MMAVSAERRARMRKYNAIRGTSEVVRQANRKRAAAWRAAKKSAAPVASTPKPEGDVPVQDDRPTRWKDPGTWISPERIDACLERIFVDPSKRLGHETRHA
jgi:hypothetical protein